MKKLLLFAPLILFNCNKKEEKIKTSLDKNPMEIEKKKSLDSTTNGVIGVNKTEEDHQISPETFRVIEGNKIIKTINADMFPLTIADEFTNDHQQFILKIKNFNNKNISGKITPENPEMNIRFNQIKLPNGDYDGPFGREISYKISEKGEIWLIIGKSNMASGEAKGKFSVNIK